MIYYVNGLTVYVIEPVFTPLGVALIIFWGWIIIRYSFNDDLFI